jgi:hypothetical protein
VTLPDLGHKHVAGPKTRRTERGKGSPAAREHSARVPLLGRLIARRHARSVGARTRRVVRRPLAVPGRTLRPSAIAELATPRGAVVVVIAGCPSDPDAFDC